MCINKQWPKPEIIAEKHADFRSDAFAYGAWSEFDLSQCDCPASSHVSVYAGTWSMGVCSACGRVVYPPECEHWIYALKDRAWVRVLAMFETNHEGTMTRCSVCGHDVT